MTRFIRANSGQQTGPSAFRYYAWAWTQRNSGCALSVTFDTNKKRENECSQQLGASDSLLLLPLKVDWHTELYFVIFFLRFSHTTHMRHFMLWKEYICHWLHSVFHSLPHPSACGKEWTDGKLSEWYRTMSHLGKNCKTRCWRKKNSVVAKYCQFSGTTNALNQNLLQDILLSCLILLYQYDAEIQCLIQHFT